MNTDIVIDGLYYFPDFLTQEEHDFLLSCVDNAVWQTDLKRRVQQYGYQYDYRKKEVNLSMKIDDLPDWSNFIFEKIKKIYHNIGNQHILFDQLIINEYETGQGITPHIDCEPCFEDTIISISLGGTCVMDFSQKKDKNTTHTLLLSPKSLLLMQGEARYEWLHGIKGKKNDIYLGQTIPRTRRVSLTFRKVILNNEY